VSWEVEFHPSCERWADDLDTEDQEALLASIRVLRRVGPALGRPLVDSVKGSKHKNMKELRPPSTGSTEVRVLFAFDPTRTAILLLGGDKSGSWNKWYDENIPRADDRYDEHLRTLHEKTTPAKQAKKKRGRQ
jgi:hypothetical protein